jgi:hypothetical protein
MGTIRRCTETAVRAKLFGMIWLPPRDSNPDMLIQSQLSYH